MSNPLVVSGANNIQLKKIVKSNGEIVRMAELKAGDIFDVFMDDNGIEKFEGRWEADEDGYIQDELRNFGEEYIGTGSVMAHLYREPEQETLDIRCTSIYN